MKNIVSILLVLVGFAANAQIQEYVIEASDSLITRGVLQINADKFKATTQVSSDDTTLVSLDYLTGMLSDKVDSLAFHSGTGYIVYYKDGAALDSTLIDGRYAKITDLDTLSFLRTEVDGSISNELQTLSFTSPNLSISSGNSVNISGINTDSQTLSTSGAAGNISISGGNTINLNVNDADASTANELQTISTTGAAGNITLSNGGGTLNLNVNDADASATNELNSSMSWNNTTNQVSVTDAGGTKSVAITGFLESEVDGSITNEGSLTVTAGTATTSVINSNTSGSTPVTISASTGLSISESGNTITLTNTSTNTDSQTLTTSGTPGNVGISGGNTITINVDDADPSTTNEIQDLSGSGAALSGYTISLSGDVTPVTLPSEADGSITNEGVLGVSAGDVNTAVITSNTSGASGITINGGANIAITETTSTNGGTINIAATGLQPTLTTGNLTESVTGLQFNATTRQVIGGAADLSLTSGYEIPTTASISNWNTAYGWGNHSGLYLPLTGGTMSNTNLVTNLNAQYLNSRLSLGYAYNDVANNTQVNDFSLPTGIYNLQGYIPTGLTTNYYNLINFKGYSAGNYTNQIALPYQGNETNDLYIRKANNGVWGDWAKVYHTQNFTAGTNYLTPHSVSNNYVLKSNGLGGISQSLFYDDGTNVGIGTSPTVKLHILGNNDGLPSTSGTSQPNASLRLGNIITNAVLDIGQNSGSGAWLQVTNIGDLSSVYPLLLNPNGGNVGIGTTAPNYLLQLATANEYQLAFQRTGISNLWGLGSDNNGMYFRDLTSGVLPMFIKEDGNIGIGTTAPSQLLDVNGNARFRSIGTTATTTVLGVTSDGTLSTNVSITGGVTWMGSWNANTNTPTLSDATGNDGEWYKVSVAGTQNLGSGSITFAVGDDVIHNGTIWEKFSVQVAETDPVYSGDPASGITSGDISNWNAAYDNQISSASFSGTTTKTLTLTQQDAGTVTASFTDNNTTYSAGEGIGASGTTFSLALQELTTGTPSLNTHWVPWVNSANNLHYRVGLLDLQGIAGYNAGKLQGVTVSSTAPTTNYVLKYNGSTWAPAVDATGSSLTAGNAIVVAGDSINYKPTKVTATMTDLNMLNNAASIYTNFEYNNTLYRTTLAQVSDLGLYNARELRGYVIASATPSTGEVLTWTGSQWEPEPPTGGGGGMTDPMTSRGDLIYRNSSNVTARLGIGGLGSQLYSNGTDVYWRIPQKSDIGLGNVENTALSTWTGSTNIGTVGSITSGNWGGDPISAVKGGTGKTSYTPYALVTGGTTSTGTLQQVAGVGSAGQVLTSNGTGALPTWQAAPTTGSGGWLDEGNYVRLNTFADRVTIGGGSDPNPFKLEVVGDGKFDNIQTGYITSLSGIRLGSYTPGQYATMGTNTLKHLQYVTPTTDIYILTPQVRVNALNASSMRYYDGRNITDTLTVNTIYYITHVPQGGDGEILVKQDGTGGRTLTLYFYDKGQTGEPDANIELTKVTVGATTAIKTTANKHTLIRYRRWGTKVTLEYLQEP